MAVTASLFVEDLDVVESIGSSYIFGFVDVFVDTLLLQTSGEVFRHGIILSKEMVKYNFLWWE